MDTLLASFYKKRNTLSSLERQVLDFLISHPETVTNLTISELAGRLFVSTATITRTAQKIGYSGYQELKYSLANYHQQSFVEKHHQGVATKINLAEYQAKIIAQLNHSFDMLKQEDLTAIIEKITTAHHLEIFAVGASFSLGMDFSKKVLHLGIKNQLQVDWDDLYVSSTLLTHRDFAIFISQSGETLQLLEYANNLQQRKVPFLTISGNQTSPLAQLADFTLIGQTDPYYYGEADLSSRLSLIMILDLLAIELAHA